MANNALASAKADAAISSARHSSAMSRLRAKNDEALAKVRGKLKEYRAGERLGAAMVFAATDVGAVLSGQIAKPTVLVNAEGKARGYMINYGASLGTAAILFGMKPSMGAIALAAGFNGLTAGQLAIDSFTKWDLNPFGNKA